MIEIFIKIENVGKFKTFHLKGDVSFRIVTLVYDGNATMKADLSEIKALHDYSKRYHHGADSTEDIWEVELEVVYAGDMSDENFTYG